MPYDSIGTMLMNIGMFSAGIAFGIIGLIVGATRGMSKNSEKWAITFSAFAWLIALMIPHTTWAVTIFIVGSIGITIAFFPILEKMKDSNIFAMAVISAIINLLLLFGTGAYQDSLDWDTNMNSIYDDVNNLLDNQTTTFGRFDDDSGLCRPDQPSTECQNDAEKGGWDSSVFNVFASVLAIGDYVSKAISFVGMVLFAPFIIGNNIQQQITNMVVFYLIAVFITIWNFAIIYKIIAFILDKRGMK